MTRLKAGRSSMRFLNPFRRSGKLCVDSVERSLAVFERTTTCGGSMSIPGDAVSNGACIVDDATMHRLLSRHSDMLRQYIGERIPPTLRRTQSPDDILQDVYVAAFRHRTGFRLVSPHAFEHWIRTIVDRRLIDVKRGASATKRGGHRPHMHPDEYSWSAVLRASPGSSNTPSREVAAEEARRAVQIGLSSLPEDVRQAMQMCVIDGRPIDEVAEEMNRSSSALRSLIYRGRSRLMRVLGNPARFFSHSRVFVSDGARNGTKDAPAGA